MALQFAMRGGLSSGTATTASRRNCLTCARPPCASAVPLLHRRTHGASLEPLLNRTINSHGFAQLCGSTTRLPSQRPDVACQAAAADVPVPEKKKTLGDTLVLGGLFGLWYLFNIYFNIYNKQVLKIYPYPITCTTLQFLVGSIIATLMWTVRLHTKPRIDTDLVVGVLPLAGVHTLGNMFTNLSLGAVAVSFTHTIKAMEPFFSVLLSAMFLGERPTLAVILCLFPIVGGVAMASLSEATFNWWGFGSAMASNVTFQSRNVLSKKFMGKGKGSLDNINLFSLITMLSFCLLLPVAVMVEGVQFTPAALSALGITDPTFIVQRALSAAVCFHAYQQVSYMILQRVSPVTHSIGNCVKRVIVIAASVLFFKNPMSTTNIVGTGVALAGVFAYSQAKRLSGKKKAA